MAQCCRLCLETSDDFVNVFQEFQDSTIASILAKHFWFQVYKNDGFSEWLCQICWMQTKKFHVFFEAIELRHCKSNEKVSIDSIKQEQSPNPEKEALELDLDLVKNEEVESLADIAPHFLLCKDESGSEFKDYNNQSDDLETSDDEDEPSNKKSKKDDGTDNQKLSSPNTEPNPERKGCTVLSRSEQEELDAKICEFFNMNCEICTNVEFVSLLEVRRHYRRVHKVKGYLTCCSRKFWRRHLMVNHIRYHTNPHAYRCDHCEKGFHHENALKSHSKCHEPFDSRAHKCSLCSKVFSNAASMKYHLKNQHVSDTEQKFTCDKCDKEFATAMSLATHNRNVHEFSHGHVCDICARQFKTKTNLKSHITSIHSIQSKVQCNICGAWLKHNTGLRRHMMTQHQDTGQEIVDCPICKRKVKNKSVLAQHLRTAHVERRHKCSWCDKAFKRAKNLKEHTALHTGEDLYNCPYCEKKFKSNGNLYSHRKKAHLAEWTRDFPQLSALKKKLTNEEDVTEKQD